MNDLEKYLLKLYSSKKNVKLYRKLYYEINKKRILDYNNKRYNDRLNKGNIEFIRKEFIITFD